MDITSIAAAQTTGAANQASSQLTANFDTFLTLLTTQLRNQDPLSPLDTEKFTEQLVQFAGVEQSIQTNQNLEALLALQSASANDTALGYVGRIVSVDSPEAALGAQNAQWRVSLPAEAESAVAQIYDAAGALIARFEAPRSAGDHDIVWDGTAANGARAREGVYRLEVLAQDATGAALTANVSARGQVDGASFSNGAPRIEIGAASYGLDAVTRVDLTF